METNRAVEIRDNLRDVLIPRGEAIVAAGVDIRPAGMTVQQFEIVQLDLVVMKEQLARIESQLDVGHSA